MYKLFDKKKRILTDSARFTASFALLFGVTFVMALFSFSFANSKSDHTSNSTPQVTRVENKSASQAAPVEEVAPIVITPGICTTTVIGFKTTTVQDPTMYQDETKETGGNDGWIKTCTADSAGVKPADENVVPTDKVITVGTKTRPAVAQPKQLTKKSGDRCERRLSNLFNLFGQCK